MEQEDFKRSNTQSEPCSRTILPNPNCVASNIANNIIQPENLNEPAGMRREASPPSLRRQTGRRQEVMVC